jgi:Polyketide cyclase / dehydrase and lipid transport
MKELTGSASASTGAAREQALALLEDIDRYPSWHPDVVKEAEVLQRDAQGHPTQARCKLHVEHGPLKRDFNLLMGVAVDPSGTIKLTRLPHESSDSERFDVTWRVDGENPSTRIALELAANLNVPRLVPLGGVGDGLAQGLVNAATRELASSP